VPLPARTFREAFGFVLGLRIHCPRCHAWRAVELSAQNLDEPFAGGRRFICRRVRRKVYGDGTEVCGGVGEPVFAPVDGPAPDRSVIDLQCGGTRPHPHPLWEMTGLDLQAPAWAGLLGEGERFQCPGCGGMARHTFHAPYPHKPSVAPPAAPTF
jgi:hypothetical protein